MSADNVITNMITVDIYKEFSSFLESEVEIIKFKVKQDVKKHLNLKLLLTSSENLLYLSGISYIVQF